MLVSVGIPTYNRPRELERALRSIINQSHRDLEIIVSNNGSTDSSVEDVIARYASADRRIRHFYQEPALRVVGNFQFLLDRAQGRYFLWLADDDWLDEDYIAHCVLAMEADGDVSLVCGRCLHHDSRGAVIRDNSNLTIDADDGLRRVREYYRTVTLNGYFYGVMRAPLAKRIPLREALGFDWLFIASLVFSGKVRVVDSVASHITVGGMSSDPESMIANIGRGSILSRHFIGLSVAINAARDIHRCPAYEIPSWRKWLCSVQIFLSAYSNTARWDAVLIARRLARAIGFPRRR
jgi:glycosyltransferase involved in cell wall biosynthesis